jgi:AcrR family transcriptional regulator
MTDQTSHAAADPRWRRQPEERPGQLLDAALHVFAEHGIAAAKLEEIAARAGVSKGTIYLYFESKEELFREVVRQLLVPRIAEGERVAGDGTASEQLERYLRHHWSCFADDGSDGWVRLVMLELHKYPELHEFYHAELIEVSNRALGGIIQRGIERGEFRQLDPIATCSMIKAITLMHVLWRGHMSSRPSVAHATREENINTIVDFVLHALRAVAVQTPTNS